MWMLQASNSSFLFPMFCDSLMLLGSFFSCSIFSFNIYWKKQQFIATCMPIPVHVKISWHVTVLCLYGCMSQISWHVLLCYLCVFAYQCHYMSQISWHVLLWYFTCRWESARQQDRKVGCTNWGYKCKIMWFTLYLSIHDCL